ncbi:hypothetical protein ABPG72_016742 [Tetrahymena utriculariae]
MNKVINLTFLIAIYSQNIFLSQGQQLTGDVQIQRSVYKNIGSSVSLDQKKYKIDISQCIFKYNFKQYIESENIISIFQIQIYYQYKKQDGDFKKLVVKAQKKNINDYQVEYDKSFFSWKYIQVTFDIFITSKILKLQLKLPLNIHSNWESSEFQNTDFNSWNIKSYKCSTCSDRPDQCITCTKEYQLAPICIKKCDQFQELDFQKNECVPLSCDNKCSPCIGKRNNCSTCRGDRQRPPYCVCEQYKYDDLKSENCLTCLIGEYIDTSSECYPDQFYLNSQSTWECIEEEMDIINDTKSKIAKYQTMMKMSLKVYINKNFQQVFRINFSSRLLKNIQKQDLAKVFQIKFENVSQNEYQIQFVDILDRYYIEFII